MANHLLLAIIIFIFFKEATAAASYNVKKFGAKPDGRTDSSKPFMSAWSAVCGSTKPATIYVPKGRYMLGGLRFRGPCKNRAITIRIDGTLVAPSDYRVLGNANYWLLFSRVEGVTIQGGTLDAQGARLWACKSANSKNCPEGATSLAIYNSNKVVVNGLTSLNSQMFHMVVNGCNNVRMIGVNVVAPWNSPNTDGIHVQYSTGVTILNSKLTTGDDCVSIGPGSSNLWIENVACGPGHGIRVTFKGTQNGLRIKSWARPSSGFVNGVLFQNAIMTNVQNPIYQDIHGTSATKVAVKFDCSKMNPCRGITMQDVNLSFKNQLSAASSYCMNAGGKASGVSLVKGSEVSQLTEPVAGKL
ncbi:Glycoside hydrolase, family 28 [Cynara cardunculus var. scolymus]|uniref:Glycoside hydrolase, family 28 n=1 Tax=Cynara cardunculus var. scolymus TaxID=59895 RepID=A0A118JZV7_CYNCS|nr:Glycoside hydrolase, family 28 [Cynara cardunculus var. scolymus]